MKKTKRTKLQLHRDTFRRLTDEEARRAAGGLYTQSKVEDGCWVTKGTCWMSQCQGCV